MKPKAYISILLSIVLSLCIFLVSCNEDNGSEGNQLGIPFVSISKDGVASWASVDNAQGYSYMINDGQPLNTSNTSVQLTDGQSIRVKAVGNGTEYTDSEYSVVQTYIANTSDLTALTAPVVSIGENGMANWNTVANASGYKYKINNGEEKSTSDTSVQLTDGQSIRVKAVGNGTEYTDSEYSVVQTYTAHKEGTAPSFIGICASNTAPDSDTELPANVILLGARMLNNRPNRSLSEAVKELYSDNGNYLGEALPNKSDYSLFSEEGQTVYIQIWLDNPSQYTILSLKLNGVKCQVGGGLSSFFKQDSDKYYNCVYVAVNIPSASYEEISYKVSEIEYIADTFINADGSDTFMNENDTVKIGLPYKENLPTVSDYSQTSLTINSYGATFTITDSENLLGKSGGWLRVVLYDGYDIVKHNKAVLGANTYDVSGLEESNYYSYYIYLYADLHDGNGVKEHILESGYFRTPEVILVERIEGVIDYNETTDQCNAKIIVRTELNSITAEYIKVEILDEKETIVYTVQEYNGYSEITTGILNNAAYTVRVYYKDNEYQSGKYIENNVYICNYGDLYLYDLNYYSLLNDAVLNFKLGNSDNSFPNFDSFVLNIYDECSARYIAESILYLLDNPTAIIDLTFQIEELRVQIDNLEYGSDERNELFVKINRLEEQKSVLEKAKWAWENNHNGNSDRNFWESEKAKGKNYYTFSYNGTDTDSLFKIGKLYYVVCKDYYKYSDFSADSLKCVITAQIDRNEGNGMEQKEISESLNRMNYSFGCNGVWTENCSGEDGNLSIGLFNMDVDNAIRFAKIGWITKITVDDQTVYEKETMPTVNFDESAWLAEYLKNIKSNTPTDGLFLKYVGTYGEPFKTTFDYKNFTAGEKAVTVYTKLFSDSAENEPVETTFTTIIHRTLDIPTVQFSDNYAVFNVNTTGSEGNYRIYVDVIDKNGDPADAFKETEGNSYWMLAVGGKIRAKAVGNNEYWKDSDWSDWYTFTGVKMTAPSLSYSLEKCAVIWDSVEGAKSYVYTINDGSEQIILANQALEVYLNYNDSVKVKAIPSEEYSSDYPYCDSNWSTYQCVDNREQLETPSDLKINGNILTWSEVTNASGYMVERIKGNKVIYDEIKTNEVSLKSGYTYRIRALDSNNVYKVSQWSCKYEYIEQLSSPSLRSVDSVNIYWNSVSNASGFNWRINDGTSNSVGTTNSDRRVPLSLLNLGDKLYVQAYYNGNDYNDSEWSMIYYYATQLSTPVVTAVDCVASWEQVENADGYIYTINDGPEVATQYLSVSGLNYGDRIKVCATSSDAKYSKSQWSSEVTVKYKLATPTVVINGSGVASWSQIPNAEYYLVKIDNGNEEQETSLSVQLSYNQEISVKAVGTGNYVDSDYSTPVLYEDNRPRLNKPTVSYNEESGVVVSYDTEGIYQLIYKLGEEGEESTINNCNFTVEYYHELGVYLSSGDTVYVKIEPVSQESTHRESEWQMFTK